jgi:flagellar M-ring protein FliF
VNKAIEFIRTLGPARIAAMTVVTLVLMGFFAYIVSRVSQPGMGVLYSDLSYQDATGIIRDLESKGIRYESRADGQTILVPKNEVTKLRMDFAGKGLPSGGGVGYEIFDKGDAFSSTSFVQGINQLRALEGELSRTIRSITRVLMARVHLVIPEKRLFDRDKEGPRASIVLKLSGDLDSGQVRAIRHLVATAVEGLKPERISIVDERGRLLADGAQGENAAGVAYDDKQNSFERRLKGQVEEIVTGVVGVGRARIQVSSELDINRVESRSESYDPESKVVRSTQTRSENQVSGGDQGAVSVGNELPNANAGQTSAASKDNSNKSEEVVNYEISRTTRTEVVEGGRVKRLSVAVLVDGIYQKSATGEMAYVPRPPEELERISALVKSAIGFDQKRGDQIEVANLRFADAPVQIEAEKATGMSSLLAFSKDDIFRLIELGVLALLTLIVMFMVVRPILKKMLAPPEILKGKPSGGGQRMVAMQQGYEGGQAPMMMPSPDGSGEMISYESSLPPLVGPRESQAAKMIEIAQINGKIQAQSVEQIGALVKNNPQESVAVIRQWIHGS